MELSKWVLQFEAGPLGVWTYPGFHNIYDGNFLYIKILKCFFTSRVTRYINFQTERKNLMDLITKIKNISGKKNTHVGKV